jgi:hypothetical protein
MKNKNMIFAVSFSLVAFCFYLPSVRAEGENQAGVLASYVGVSGDDKMFKQNTWMNTGFNGGLEDLVLSQDLGDGKVLKVEGQALSDSDYKFLMGLKKEDFGYLKLKFNQYRKYYDDSGEYYNFPRPGTALNWYELGHTLHTDRSDFSLDLGLTIPDRPKYTLGYERQTKSGEELIGNGAVRDTRGNGVGADDVVKYVYPNTKNMDWVVDTLKAGTEFNLKGTDIAVNQKLEAYSNHDFAKNVFELRDNSFPAYETEGLYEKPSYKSATTTILANNQLNDQLYMKGGYLFNTLDGKTKWDRNYYVASGALGASYFNGNEESNLNSNVFNWGANYKPFKDLLFTTRLRYENTVTAASSSYMRDGIYFLIPGQTFNGVLDFIQYADTDVHKSAFAESIGVQYSVLPRTIISLDVDSEQDQLKIAEHAFTSGAGIFGYNYTREAHYDYDKDTYTIGINSRPIKPVFISARYRRIDRQNDYDEQVDTQNGYPGWIGDNGRVTDEYTARIDLKPNRMISFTAKYADRQTQYDLSKNVVSEIAAATTQTTSFGVSFVPTPKLYINTLYSFQNLGLRTNTVGAATFPLASFNGDSNSSITMVSYSFSDKTSLNSQYQWWKAQESKAISQGLSLALDQRLKENLGLKVGYGYYTFESEETSGNNNYTANVVYTSLTGKF